MTKNAYLLKLGRHIANLRAEKGFSQAAFARLCKKSPQNYYRIENGIVNISIFNLKSIADNLNMTLSELLDF
jgi:putative transcriptional regulator